MASSLRPGQELFVRDAEEVKDWKRSEGDKGIELLEVVKQAKPTMLIGCSTMSGAFSEQIVKEMAKHVARPVIFPLSNPTRLAEADPSQSRSLRGFSLDASPSPQVELMCSCFSSGDINEWTEGRALMATGSPFPPVANPNGKLHKIAEANNALIYPGFGLGYDRTLPASARSP